MSYAMLYKQMLAGLTVQEMSNHLGDKPEYIGYTATEQRVVFFNFTDNSYIKFNLKTNKVSLR